MTNEYLQHYGVLGMKWGRRKKSSSNNDSPDYINKEKLKKKRLSEMSNAELKEFTNRMQLEKSYKDLNKKQVSAGRKFATDFISNSTKAGLTVAGTAVVSTLAVKAGKSAINSMMRSGPPTAGNQIAIDILKKIFKS